MKKACYICKENSYTCVVPSRPCNKYKPVKRRCRGCIKLKDLESCMDGRDRWRKLYLAATKDCDDLLDIIHDLREELELEKD